MGFKIARTKAIVAASGRAIDKTDSAGIGDSGLMAASCDLISTSLVHGMTSVLQTISLPHLF